MKYEITEAEQAEIDRRLKSSKYYVAEETKRLEKLQADLESAERSMTDPQAIELLGKEEVERIISFTINRLNEDIDICQRTLKNYQDSLDGGIEAEIQERHSKAEKKAKKVQADRERWGGTQNDIVMIDETPMRILWIGITKRGEASMKAVNALMVGSWINRDGFGGFSGGAAPQWFSLEGPEAVSPVFHMEGCEWSKKQRAQKRRERRARLKSAK